MIILNVLVLAFLLEVDEYVFITFFAKRDDLNHVLTGHLNSVIMGHKTSARCESVRNHVTIAVTAYQVSMMILLKTHPYVEALWTMPFFALLLMWLQNRQFYGQQKTHKFVDPKIILGGMLLFWFSSFRCVITPLCGPGSRYFMTTPW